MQNVGILENTDCRNNSHTNVDYDFVQENSVYVFDTKNAMKDVKKMDNI